MSPEPVESSKPTPPLDHAASATMTPAEPTPPHTKHAASPATLTLQWLTYAFWGFTTLALSVLTFIVMFNLLNGSNSEYASLYTLAAIIVLLPISLVCDFLYQKREPAKKTGASAAILAIHAVLFAILSIGMLIAGLFSTIRLVTETTTTSSSDAAVAMLVSSLIVTVLYGMIFLRTLNPFAATKKFPLINAIAMSAVTVLFAVLAFVGPFASTTRTKTDRFIDANLSTVSYAVEEYVSRENKLPANLSALSLNDEESRKLIDDKLVTYSAQPETATELRYQLCVTYKEKDTGSSYRDMSEHGEYRNYLSTAGHPAGDVCYKLRVEKPTRNNLQIFNRATE